MALNRRVIFPSGVVRKDRKDSSPFLPVNLSRAPISLINPYISKKCLGILGNYSQEKSGNYEEAVNIQ